MAQTDSHIRVAAIPVAGGFLNELGQDSRKVWRVILNAGSEDGVRIGQDFVVYALGDELIDPMTGKSLGAYEIVRGRGEVVHVQDKMCTIKSVDTNEVVQASTNALAVAAGIGGRPQKIEVPFAYVEVGDRARRI